MFEKLIICDSLNFFSLCYGNNKKMITTLAFSFFYSEILFKECGVCRRKWKRPSLVAIESCVYTVLHLKWYEFKYNFLYYFVIHFAFLIVVGFFVYSLIIEENEFLKHVVRQIVIQKNKHEEYEGWRGQLFSASIKLLKYEWMKLQFVIEKKNLLFRRRMM